MAKVRFIRIMVSELELDPERYPEGMTPEQMAKHDLEQMNATGNYEAYFRSLLLDCIHFDVVREDTSSPDFTGFRDRDNDPIFDGDILQNPMVYDLWIIEKDGDIYKACLVPNSGLIGHPDSAKYPLHTEDLEDIADVFKKIGNRHTTPELVKLK